MLTPEDDRRNSTRQYNKMSIADLYTLVPQVSITASWLIGKNGELIFLANDNMVRNALDVSQLAWL